MYDMLNMKDLRDRHAKLSNDTIRVAEEGYIDLNVIVNEEAEQYEKATRVQGVIHNTTFISYSAKSVYLLKSYFGTCLSLIPCVGLWINRE